MGIGRDVLAVLVGVSVFAVYAAAAALVYLGLLFALQAPSSPWIALATIAVATLTFGYLSYRFGTAELLAGLRARELPRRRAPRFHRMLDDLCERMDLRRPDVYLANMDQPNALALGGTRRGALVIDPSLLRALAPRECRAIVAHELAHLESNDGLVQTLAYTTMRTIVGLCLLLLLPLLLFVFGLARAVAWIRGRPSEFGGPLMGVYRLVSDGLGVLLLGFTLLVRAHSRKREYAADDRAVEVTGDPLALASALRKIQRLSEPPWGILAPLYVQGDEEGRLSKWFSTHPPMDERIDRLLEEADRRRGAVRRIPVRL